MLNEPNHLMIIEGEIKRKRKKLKARDEESITKFKKLKYVKLERGTVWR